VRTEDPGATGGTRPGDRVTLRQLRYFVAVAEELHFGRAAERLHVSQPPLSKQIQLLEARIGVRLLDRNRRRVLLTPEGEHFLADARGLLDRLDRAVERVRLVAAGETGELRLGFVGSSAIDLVPALTRRFHEDHPNVRLTLREMTTVDALEALVADELDAALVRDPPDRQGVRTRTIRDEPFVVALPVGHRFAERDRISLVDLRAIPLVLHPRALSPRFADHLVALCREAGFTPLVAQEAVHLHTHLSLVAAGVGASLLPRVVEGLPWPGVRLVPLSEAGHTTRTCLAWASARTGPIVRHLLEAANAVSPPPPPA
jgi:DNA-binding transcriptional LysR family regulator